MNVSVKSRYAEEMKAAIHAANAAAAVITAKWDQTLNVQKKGSVDLVTEVDQAAEDAILSVLRSRYPADEFIAEETGAYPGTSGRVWYIDPLDGTTNFSHGFPHFCTSIGLFSEGRPLVAVITEPLRDWCFTAEQGCGAYLNGKKLKVSTTDTLTDALLATGFPYDRWTNPDNNSHRVAHILRRCQGVRRAGAAALDLAYTAAGWLDGYWEDRLNPWDVGAGLLLVQEAGGIVSDFQGQPARAESPSFVAANAGLHPALLDAVNEAPPIDTKTRLRGGGSS